MQLSEAPLRLRQLRCEPVEQRRMRRRLAVGAQVERRRHDRLAEMPQPDMIDGHTRRRRMFGPSEPACEGQTPAGAGFGTANALATVIGVWDAPQPQFEKARALLDAATDVRAGVTLVNGVMVARLLGEATVVRHAAIRFLTDFRGRRLPRVWHV